MCLKSRKPKNFLTFIWRFPLLLRLKESKKQGKGIKSLFIELLLNPDPTTNGMQNTNCDPGKQPRGFCPWGCLRFDQADRFKKKSPEGPHGSQKHRGGH